MTSKTLNIFIFLILGIVSLCTISNGLNVRNECLFIEEGVPFSLDKPIYIYFFIPHDWTNNEDNLNYLNIKIMSTNVVLRHPLSSEERPDEIKLPLDEEMRIGWNRLFLKKKRNNVEVKIANGDDRKLLRKVALLDIKPDGQPFLVTGLYSLVNCLKARKRIYYNIRANSKFRIPFILYKKANKFEAFSKTNSFNFQPICSGRRQKVCKNGIDSTDSFTIRTNCENGSPSSFSRNIVNEVYVSAKAFGSEDLVNYNYSAFINLVLENTGNADFYIEMDVIPPSNAPISLLRDTLLESPTEEPTTSSTTTTTTTSSEATAVIDPVIPLEKGCGISSKTNILTRIAGGEKTNEKDWPWMVAFVRSNDGLGAGDTHFCGGVLIAQTLVLTSANCFYDMTYDDVKARLGEHDFDTHLEGIHVDFKIAAVKIHEMYNPDINNEHDIALVKLESLTGGSFSPVCLPPSGINWEDQYGYITGWGTIFFGEPDNNLLREALVQIWKQSDCVAAYSSDSTQVTDNMICAGGRDQKGSCEGDAGGPLVAQILPDTRWYVVGIDSWGLGCGLDNSPTFYTKVDKYLQWIQDNKNI